MRDLPDRRLRRPRYGLALAGGAACLLLGLGCAVLVSPTTHATFAPNGREVVAFLAPYDALDGDRTRDDYAATLTALRRGLSHLATCTELPPEAIHLLLVERVTVVHGAESHDFELPTLAGILLMDGGRAPLLVDPGSDPAAIPSALAAHASDYFARPGCRPDGS